LCSPDCVAIDPSLKNVEFPDRVALIPLSQKIELPLLVQLSAFAPEIAKARIPASTQRMIISR